MNFRSRLLFTTVLSSTMGAATFALTAYAVLAAELRGEFGVDRWQIGALVTAMSLGGALISPRVGSIADAIGAKRSTTTTIALATVALVGLAVAPAYWVIVTAALVGGVAQAMANPATNKLIALHVEPGRRGVITGIKQSGVTAASALGGILLPPVTILAGWRWAVALFALIAAGGGVLSLLVPADPARDAAPHGEGKEPIDPYIFRLAIYGFILGAAGTAIFTFLPLYAEESLGLGPASAGLAVAVTGVAGVVGRILWGRFAEIRFGTWRSLEYIAVLAAGAAAVLVAAQEVTWLVWVAAVLTGFSASAWNSVGMLAVIETATPAQAGRASGVVLFGFLAGLGLGAPAFGFGVDQSGTYGPGWTAVGVAF
ncbi:MAG: MFS transporter, partial [Acidimicrobiia bacterium]|nr:MFS transporter [Acidimicrobiia bacterium]